MVSIEKNNTISLWRIFFAYVIMIYHFLNSYSIGSSLYIATDFFFLVSGFLLAMEADTVRFRTAADMLRYKIKKYYPHYLFSLLISLSVFKILQKGPQVTAGQFLAELTFIQMIGLNLTQMVNVPTWYISVILISGYVIYFMLINYRRLYIELLTPAWIVIIFTWFFRNYGNLRLSSLGPDITVGIYWNLPLIFGSAMLGLGVLLYYLPIKRICGGGINICLEVVLMLSVPILAMIYRYTWYDYIMVLFLSIGIKLSFHNGCFALYDNKSIRYVSRLSYPLYLNHNMFRELFPYYIKKFSIVALLVYLLIVTCYSIFTMSIVDYIIKRKG